MKLAYIIFIALVVVSCIKNSDSQNKQPNDISPHDSEAEKSDKISLSPDKKDNQTLFVESYYSAEPKGKGLLIINFFDAPYVLVANQEETEPKLTYVLYQFNESIDFEKRMLWVNNQHSDGIYEIDFAPIKSYDLTQEITLEVGSETSVSRDNGYECTQVKAHFKHGNIKVNESIEINAFEYNDFTLLVECVVQ